MDAHGEPITAPFTLLVFPCCEFHWFNYLTCLFPMYAWLLYKEQLLWGETTGNIYAMLLQYFYLCCCFTALCLCFAFIFYWFPHSHIFLFIYILLRIYVNILHFYSSFSHSHFFFLFFWGFKSMKNTFHSAKTLQTCSSLTPKTFVVLLYRHAFLRVCLRTTLNVTREFSVRVDG